MVVNLKSAFKFPFKDKKWPVKLLIGGILICIPIANFLVFGYLLKILEDAKDKKEAALPEWTDWAGLFQEGFRAFIVGLCYLLCFFLLSVVFGILGYIPIIGCLIIPIQIAAGFLWGSVVAVALCFYLERKDLGAAFNFKGILEKFKKNITDYLIIALIIGVLFTVSTVPLYTVSIVTLILVVFIWFYLYVVGFRLYGEAFSVGKAA